MGCLVLGVEAADGREGLPESAVVAVFVVDGDLVAEFRGFSVRVAAERVLSLLHFVPVYASGA